MWGEHNSLREVRTDRQHTQPPMPSTGALNPAALNPAAMLGYAIEGLDMIARGKTLCLSELLMLEPDNYP